jgi:hypothetical protein
MSQNCEKCGLRSEWQEGGMYCYRDEENGIPKDITICEKCLYAHVSLHYPGCANQLFLEDRFPELKIAEVGR